MKLLVQFVWPADVEAALRVLRKVGFREVVVLRVEDDAAVSDSGRWQDRVRSRMPAGIGRGSER